MDHDRKLETRRDDTNRCLASTGVVREETNRPLSGLRLWANLVHTRRADLLSTVFPFIHPHGRTTPGLLLSLRRRPEEDGSPRRRIREPFRTMPYKRPSALGNEQRRGTSPVEFAIHCLQVMPSSTYRAGEGNRLCLTRNPPREGGNMLHPEGRDWHYPTGWHDIPRSRAIWPLREDPLRGHILAAFPPSTTEVLIAPSAPVRTGTGRIRFTHGIKPHNINRTV